MSAIVRNTSRQLKLAIFVALCGCAVMFTACDADDLACTSDYDCEEARICDESKKCVNNLCRDCGVNETCVNNACVPK